VRLCGSGARLGLALMMMAGAFAVPAEARTVRIDVADMAFKPANVTVAAGDTIEWVNHDFVDHTSTVKGGAWDLVLPKGTTVEFTPKTPGTFAYFCRYHPQMTGSITVGP
jgi:plastocyanin